jgi:hypothetical protein
MQSKPNLAKDLKELGFIFEDNEYPNSEIYGKTLDFESKDFNLIVTDKSEVFLMVRGCLKEPVIYIETLDELNNFWRYLTNEYICKIEIKN